LTLDKLLSLNKIIARVTWVLLAVGSVDHFSCELEITSFACEFLPHQIAAHNLTLLWVLIGIIFLGETAAWAWRRRLARKDSAET
jgi:hypothetical protein|tara:strand:- start:912 stop:1166 length:255 start_codon:yes stop_codon:yes gene_type:complete